MLHAILILEINIVFHPLKYKRFFFTEREIDRDQQKALSLRAIFLFKKEFYRVELIVILINR